MTYSEKNRLKDIIQHYGGEIPNPYTSKDLLDSLASLMDRKQEAIHKYELEFNYQLTLMREERERP